MKLSMLSISQGGIQFMLDTPTKTFSCRNFECQQSLQKLVIPKCTGDQALCPVRAVLDYISKTSFWRNGLDALLICHQYQKSKPATRPTVNRWVKNHMSKAGVGQFQVRSHRHSSSTTALLCGLNLDSLMSQVGWVSSCMFVEHYMLPMAKHALIPHNNVDPSKAIIQDKHNFSTLWDSNAPRSNVAANRRIRKAQKFLDKHRISKPMQQSVQEAVEDITDKEHLVVVELGAENFADNPTILDIPGMEHFPDLASPQEVSLPNLAQMDEVSNLLKLIDSAECTGSRRKKSIKQVVLCRE